MEPATDSNQSPRVLQSVTTFPGSVQRGQTLLPTNPSTFVGRVSLLESIGHLLAQPATRLLTLVGPGGVGKTRLALEAINRFQTRHHDGVVFVSLVAARCRADIERGLAQALSIPAGDLAELHERIAHALRDRAVLIVFDNFEQVVQDASPLVAYLQVSPRSSILVTSRIPLRLNGETVVNIPPLDLNPRSRSGTGQSVEGGVEAQSEAAQLFAARAAATRSDALADPEAGRLVTDICVQLDGLPLAIELAAARTTHLTLSDLQLRLQSRLPLLTRGPSDLPERHRTMRDAIAWSYDLLSNEEQRLFCQLSVFAGGFTLNSAEALVRILDAPTGQSTSVLDLLASLVEHSLIGMTPASATDTRYGFLETIREFALEQAQATGTLAECQRAHAHVFLRFAQRYGLAECAPPEDQAPARLDAELANLRTALAWFRENGDHDHLLDFAVALSRFWVLSSHGLLREGQDWLEIALARSETSSDHLRASAYAGIGTIALHLGERDRARASLNDAIETGIRADNAFAVAHAALGLGAVAIQEDDLDRAMRYFRDAVSAAAKIDDPRLATVQTGRGLANLGLAARLLGDYTSSLQHHNDALDRFRKANYLFGISNGYGDLGELARVTGAHDLAWAHYQECLRLNRTLNNPRIAHSALASMAVVAAARQDWQLAARWMGAAESFRSRIGLSLTFPSDWSDHEAAREATREAIGDAGFLKAWEEGHAMSIVVALDEAVSTTLRRLESVTGGSTKSNLSFTPRERDVIRLLARGLTDREIADHLFLSRRTIETHVSRVLKKLNVRTRSAAVVAAIAAGLNEEPTS